MCEGFYKNFEMKICVGCDGDCEGKNMWVIAWVIDGQVFGNGVGVERTNGGIFEEMFEGRKAHGNFGWRKVWELNKNN